MLKKHTGLLAFAALVMTPVIVLSACSSTNPPLTMNSNSAPPSASQPSPVPLNIELTSPPPQSYVSIPASTAPRPSQTQVAPTSVVEPSQTALPAPTPTPKVLAPVPFQSLQWIKTGGPMGGVGYDIRMRQDNPDIMFVTDAWSGVFTSRDAGKTWTSANEGISTRVGPSGDAIPVFCLTISPQNPDVMWAGTQGTRGIFKTVDGGKTWVKKDNGVVEQDGITFRGMAVDPRNPDIVYASGEVSSWNWAGQQKVGKAFDLVKGVVYRSTDGGNNWSAIWRGDNLARYVWIDPRDSNVIYISTGLFDREAANSDPGKNQPGGVGIVKSTDGGKTWQVFNQQNGLNNLYLGTLFMNPQNPDVLLAGAGNNSYMEGAGIYLTTNGGQSWQEVQASLNNQPICSVEFSTSDPKIAYAASPEVIYRSQDGGHTWKIQSGGPPLQGWGAPGIRAGFTIDFQVDPRNPDRLFANNYAGGNFLSEDGGKTWVAASQGYTGAQVKSIAVDSRDPKNIFAMGRLGIFHSSTAGASWEGLNFPPIVMSEWGTVAVDPGNPANILVSDFPGGMILRSSNGGRSWNLVFHHPQVNQAVMSTLNGFAALTFAPSKPSVVYAGMRRGGDQSFMLRGDPSFGIFRSNDGGASWRESNDAVSSGQNINALAVDPTNDQVAYAGTFKVGVLKTSDGGQTWKVSSQGLTTSDVRSLAIDSKNPQVIYAGTENGGLFKSSDGAATWQPANGGLEPQSAIHAVVVDPTNSQIVYAGDQRSGVYRSDDGGQQWKILNNGLRTRAVNALVVTADGSLLYAATEGEGVYSLEIAR